MRPDPEGLALLLGPDPAVAGVEALRQLGVEGVEVGDVGRRVALLAGGERPLHPVGEAVALGQAQAEQPLGEGRERGRGEAEEAGRHLGVEQGRRHDPAGPFEDLEVLVGGMHDAGAGPLEDLAEGGDVDGERVHQGDAPGPGDLHEGELGPVRALPMELGVDPVQRLALQGGHEVLEGGIGADPLARRHLALLATHRRRAHPCTNPASSPVTSTPMASVACSALIARKVDTASATGRP